MYIKFLKRTKDFLLSLLSLLFLIPLLSPLMLLLLVTGENQVFYLQTRVGYLNGKFKIWKFATMIKNSPNLGTGSLTLRDDPRILPIGKFLRSTKINELPQIFNVLLGNMSIVGPRPQMEVDFYKFPKKIQNQIYNVKPGITGIGSIIFRDEEKWISNHIGDKHEFYRDHIAPYKGELEIWYQNNLNFYTDLKIIFLTVWVIFFSKSNLPYILLNNLPKKPDNLN